MQTRKNRLFSLIIFICLLTSFFCFEELGSKRMESVSNANQTPLFSNGYSFPNNDICTIEMLHNTNPTLQSLRSSKPNTFIQLKTRLQVALIGLPCVLSQANDYFTSENATVCMENTRVAQIIRFIHNIDGKK